MAVKLEDFKTVLYRQEDGAWVAEIPAISGLLCSHAHQGSGTR
jgi:predicted RNase H-like HicB family nuclease